MTESSLGQAGFEIGLVLAVNTEDCTCTIRTEMSETYHENIPWMVPGLHQPTGSSITYYPQTGETCIVCTTSDGVRFILGFLPTINEESDYTANRYPANPGDIQVQGADGNFLHIYRGGILRIGSSSVCQSIYIPYKSLQHHICENFILDTFAGSLEFTTNRKEDSGDGKQKCEMKLKILENADDKEETVNLLAGQGIELRIRTGGSETMSLVVKKTGEIEIVTKKTFSLKTKENIIMKSDQDVSIESQNTTLKSNTKISAQAQTIELTGTTNNIKGNSNFSGGVVKLSGGAKYPVIIGSPGFLTWISTISAKSMVPPPTDIFVSPTALA